MKTQEQKRPSHYQVHFLKERCKGCLFCVEFCPQKALGKSAQMNTHGYHVAQQEDSDKCTGCNICAMICPEFAVIVVPREE